MPQEQQIKITTSKDKTQIAYAQSGKGAPLVRAGTWLTHLQYDWESPIHAHWLRFLSEQNTLIRYDPRGYGLSQRNVSDVSLEHWVDDLEAVVDDLKLEKFPLLGMSQGAAVSVLYALRHPEKVSHLILYAPLITGWRNRKSPMAQRWSAMENIANTGWGEENLAFPTMFAQLFMPGATPEFVNAYAKLQHKCLDKEMAGKMIAALAEISVFDRLKELRIPTTVIQVSNDQAVPAESARGIASEIPGCEFVSVESNNHILQEQETGWEEFKRHFHRVLPAERTANESPFKPAISDKLNGLSKREQEVLSHLKEGLSNKEIAARLFISEKTARNHVSNILAKLGLDSRSQVIAALQ